MISNFSPGSNPQEKSFDFHMIKFDCLLVEMEYTFSNVSMWDCLLQHSSYFLLCEVIYSSQVFLIFSKEKGKTGKQL